MYLIYLVEKNLTHTAKLKHQPSVRMVLDQIELMAQGGPAPTEPEAAL
jgi:hypothetical protein